MKESNINDNNAIIKQLAKQIFDSILSPYMKESNMNVSNVITELIFQQLLEYIKRLNIQLGKVSKKKSAEFSALFKTHPPHLQSAEKK